MPFDNTGTGPTAVTAVSPTLPSGVPDPAHPGYDTHGYRLGASVSNGTVTIPNSATGNTASFGIGNPLASLNFDKTPAPADPNKLMTSPTGPFPGWGGWTTPPQWTDPTMEQVQQQPGFQFGQQQGQQALEQDKAQQGLLYGGGTLKDILAWGQNYATQFYNNTRQNMLGSYNTNVNNWQNAWNQWDASRNYAIKAANTFA